MLVDMMGQRMNLHKELRMKKMELHKKILSGVFQKLQTKLTFGLKIFFVEKKNDSVRNF